MRGSGPCVGDIEEELVGIAPPPVFAGLEGPDQRMVGVLVRVRGRVLVR